MSRTGIKNGISKHAPKILTALAIVEFAATVYLAVRATPKAEKEIHQAEAEKGASLTAVETVKAAWKCYIPAAITGACAVTTAISAQSISTKRHAALMHAYQVAESTLHTYRDKVVETIGEKKETAIRDAIAQDEFNERPIDETRIIVTDRGRTLFRDWISGRDFTHDRVKIEQAVNNLNARMLVDNCISVNDYYAELNVPELTDLGIGDDLGWNTDRTGLISVRFSPAENSNGEPCFLVHFDRPPVYDYRW